MKQMALCWSALEGNCLSLTTRNNPRNTLHQNTFCILSYAPRPVIVRGMLCLRVAFVLNLAVAATHLWIRTISKRVCCEEHKEPMLNSPNIVEALQTTLLAHQQQRLLRTAREPGDFLYSEAEKAQGREMYSCGPIVVQ